MPRSGGYQVTTDQRDEKPAIVWPLVRLLLAWGGAALGLETAAQWYADGYSVAAVIACAAVVGWLAGLYPAQQEESDSS